MVGFCSHDINEDVFKFGTPKSENDSFQWRGRPLCDIAEELGMHYTIPIILSHHMRSQHTHTQSHVQPLMTLWNSVSVAFQTVRSCLAKIFFECRILNIKTSKHNDPKHTAVVWANLTRIRQHSIQWVNGRFFIQEIEKVMAWFARTAWFGENDLKLFPSL